jgi:BA14K-like protein
MQSKPLAWAAALALSATAVLATIAPAAAEYGYDWGSDPAYTYDWGPRPDPGYAYDPGYAADPRDVPRPGYAYVPGYDDRTAPVDDDAYCAQRFRSYDPASGTYLGYDGFRHACP